MYVTKMVWEKSMSAMDSLLVDLDKVLDDFEAEGNHANFSNWSEVAT